MITFRNTHHTSLNNQGLITVVAKYAKQLKLCKNIDIVFDKRLVKVNGYHSFNVSKQCHLIQISPRLDENECGIAFKFKIISVILHELRHAQQRERNHHMVHASKKKSFASNISSLELASWYSIQETDARSYENKNIHGAVKIYDDKVSFSLDV